MTRLEVISVLSTVGLTIGLMIFAGIIGSRYQAGNAQWGLSLAATVGALGGLAHEIAQSGGKLLFFSKKADGFYLGSVAGLVLGAVAGIMVARVLFSDPPSNMTAAQLSYEAFLAGLGLKGVVEAAGGQPVSQTQQTNQPNPGAAPQLPPPPPQAPQE
jgi:hypothetical protein